MSSKYTKTFYIPLPADKVDADYIADLDPVEDAEEIKAAKSIIAYQVHGAKITCHQASEFVLVEVLVHLLQVGFIREPKTAS